MNVFERMGRLLRADAHGLMDGLEERSLLLKQHLREAEIEVARKRAELESLDDRIKGAAEDLQRSETVVAELDEDVELAMEGEDRELERFAVRRLLPKRALCRQQQERLEEWRSRRGELAARLLEQEGQLVELQTRVRAELERPSPLPGCPGPAAESAISEEEVEIELMRRRRARAAGEARSVSEGVPR